MPRLHCPGRSETPAFSELCCSVAAMANCGYCPIDLVTIRISTMAHDDAKVDDEDSSPKRLQPVVAVVFGDLLAFMIADVLQICSCVRVSLGNWVDGLSV